MSGLGDRITNMQGLISCCKNTWNLSMEKWGQLQISAGSQESYRLLDWLKRDLHIQPLSRFF